MAESACQCRRQGFDLWIGKIPWRRKWQPTPVFLLKNPMDRGAWQATVHEVKKSQVQLCNRTCMPSHSAYGVCPTWYPPHFLWVVGPTGVDSPDPNRNCVTGLDGHITRFKCKSLCSGHLELIKWFSLVFFFFCFFASGCCEAYIKFKKKWKC